MKTPESELFEIAESPDDWKPKYDLLAKECKMNESLDQAIANIREFYQNIIKKTPLNSRLVP